MDLGQTLNLYLLKRIFNAVFAIFIISFIIFMIVNLLPGSAANMILGQQATEERVDQIEEELGLDRPFHVRYIDWISGVIRGDWGTSYVKNQPVIDLVIPRLIRSLQLALLSMLILGFTAIPLGVLASFTRGSTIDNIIVTVAYIGISFPEFVTGTFLLLILTGPTSIFPPGGYAPISEGIIPWLSHLILPAITLNIVMFAHVMRQTRSSMIDEFQAKYTRTARLKGFDELTLIVKHVLRNGLLPTITVLALNFGWLMGSLVIVEQIFNFPGLGRLLINSIQDRDIPLIQITVLIAASSYVWANLIADLLYARLDPRITLGDTR